MIIVYLNLFNGKYKVRVKEFNNIGDLRITIGLWLDIEPNTFKFGFERILSTMKIIYSIS
jgi:hypothetical protein